MAKKTKKLPWEKNESKKGEEKSESKKDKAKEKKAGLKDRVSQRGKDSFSVEELPGVF